MLDTLTLASSLPMGLRWTYVSALTGVGCLIQVARHYSQKLNYTLSWTQELLVMEA